MGTGRSDLVQAMLERLELLAQKCPAQGLPSVPPGPKGRSLVDSLVTRAVEIHDGDYESTLSALQTTHAEPMRSTLPRPRVDAQPLRASLEVATEIQGRYVTGHTGTEEELGRGGMGRVLLTLDRHMGREVAVKELLIAGTGSTEVAEAELRFMREAKICAQLEHPNVIPVYELGRRANGSLYYTMKVIRGRTLATALEAATTTRARLDLLGHYAGICQAIAYAHSQGIVHGDLKPQNVMIGEFGETLVLDWGGAKLRPKAALRFAELGDERSPSQRPQEAWLGTPLYMSPEQAVGDVANVDERSDVWALGVLLYQLLTGTYPFMAGSVAELIPKIAEGRFTQAQRRAPAIDPALNAIIDRALARDLTLRYPSARELMKDIESYRSGDRVGSYAYSLVELLARFIARNRAAFVIALASFALLVGLSLMSYRRLTQSRDRAIAAETSAKTSEKQALHHLAEVFSTQATVAQAEGDPVAASLFAAKALALEERSDARGYAIALRDSLRWTPQERVRGCTRTAFSATGELACARATGSTLTDGPRALPLPLDFDTRGRWFLASDGRTLVSIGNNQVDILRTRSTELVRVGQYPVPGASCGAATSDGRVIAIGSQRGDVVLLRDGRVEATLALGEPASAVAMAPDGSVFAGGRLGKLVHFSRIPHVNSQESSAGGSATVQFREVRLSGHAGTITALQVSDSGALLASSSADRSVRLWPIDSNSAEPPVSKVMSDDTAAALAFSPDGKWLAYSAGDYSLRVYDLAKQRHVARLRAHNSVVDQIAFSSNSDLLSSSSDLALQRWRHQPPTEPRELLNRSNVLALASRADGRSLVSAGLGSSGICIWEIKTGHCKTRLPAAADAVRALALSPDGKVLGVAGSKGYAMLWNTEEHLPLRILAGHTADVRSIAFSADGSRILTASLDGSTREWSAATGAEQHRASGGAASAARYSGDGTRIAVALRSGIVQLLDARDFRVLAQFNGSSDWATDVAFAHDDQRLIVGYADRAVRVFELATGRQMGQLDGFRGRVLRVAVAPNQKWFAAAGEDPVVRLYNAESLALVAELEQHSADVRDIAFTDGGSYLLSGGDDGLIRFWPLQALQTQGKAWLEQLEQDQGLTLHGTSLQPSDTMP